MMNIQKTNTLSCYIMLLFALLFVYSSITSWIIYAEVAATYANVYSTMLDAGFENIMALPETINYRMIVLLVSIPLMGAGLIIPIGLKIYNKANALTDELNELNEYRAMNRLD
jgi:hypothetical protein